jgi:hypothetical protein
MDITIKVDTTNLKLQEKAREINEMLTRTVQEVIERVFAESQILVPVNTGALKASGKVVKEPSSNNGAFVGSYVTYGDGMVDYAVKVHEDLGMYHKAPTQAKYLEAPLLQNKDVLENLIRSRLQVILAS